MLSNNSLLKDRCFTLQVGNMKALSDLEALFIGGLLAEDPLVSPYVTRIDGGLDAIMGMSKNTVMTLLVQLWNRVSTKA